MQTIYRIPVEQINKRTELFKIALTHFESNLISGDEPVVCKLIETLKINHVDHSCVPCNLGNALDEIHKFLQVAAEGNANFPVDQSMSILLLALNRFVEMVDDLLKMLSVPESARIQFFVNRWKRIRSWANFVKHPGQFAWLVHHPRIAFDGDDLQNSDKCFEVDSKFVAEYFRDPNTKKGLTPILQKHGKNICVRYPQPKDLVADASIIAHAFCEMIRENRLFREMLSKESVIADYWSNVERQELEPAA